MKLTDRQKKILSISVFAVFLLFCGAVSWYIGRPMIKFAGEPEKFRDWVELHGIFGEIAFVGMVFLQVVVALIPGEPLELVAGYAFGAFKGTVLTVIGITLGSIAVYFLVKKLGIKLLSVFFKPEKLNELKILKSHKSRNILLFILFFLPGTPKDLLTYFAGLTDINFWYFMLCAAFVRLPSIVTSTFTGGALGLEKYQTAILFFALTAVISLTGILIYKKITSRSEKYAGNEKPD